MFTLNDYLFVIMLVATSEGNDTTVSSVLVNVSGVERIMSDTSYADSFKEFKGLGEEASLSPFRDFLCTKFGRDTFIREKALE